MNLYEHCKDSVAGIWPIWSLKVVYCGSRGSRSGQILDILVILGGAGDIYNSIGMYKYCDEAYNHLGIYVNKLLSAWT